MKYFSKHIACVCMLLKNFPNKLGINNHIIMQNEPWTGQNNTLTSRKTNFSLCRVCCWLYICWIIQLYSLGDIGSTSVLLWDLVANMHIITCFLRFYKEDHYISIQITPTNIEVCVYSEQVYPSQRAEGRCFAHVSGSADECKTKHQVSLQKHFWYLFSLNKLLVLKKRDCCYTQSVKSKMEASRPTHIQEACFVQVPGVSCRFTLDLDGEVLHIWVCL